MKRLGAGGKGTPKQAKGSVEAHDAPCNMIITDGVRYRLYEGERGFRPAAYANLARLNQPAAELFARVQRPQEDRNGTLV